MAKRLGILTGGGDAPGLNAVIRAVVRVAVGGLGWEVLGIEDGFEGLLPPNRARPLTLSTVRGILPRGGTILGTTNKGRLVVNQQVDRGVAAELVANMDALGLEGVVVVGGEGSLKIASVLVECGARIVGVPKTIDNDLGGTDLTFGFDTALELATDAVDRLHTTAESHERVMLVEVMGRHVGWIALHAGIAGGADVILIPEIPFTVEAIAEKIRQRDARGAKFSIVVVAEGARPRGGSEMYKERGRLGGMAEHLAPDLSACCGKEVRVVVLGHLQRGGSPSSFDRVLATRFGAHAVWLVQESRWGEMVALRGTEIVSVPITEAVAHLKQVPPEGQLVRVARGLGISFGNEPVP